MKSILRTSSILFFISPFLSIPYILFDVYKRKHNAIIFLSLLFGILTYLYLPSTVQDGALRYELYETFKSYSIHEFQIEYLNFRADFIFYILIFIFSYLGIKFQILLLLFGFFNTYVSLSIFEKIISNYKVSNDRYFLFFTLILLTFSLTFLFSGVRNNLAYSFFFIAFYQYFFRKKIIIPIIFFLIAVATHFSLIIYLPILLFFRKINFNFLMPVFILITIISLLLPSDLIQSLFTSIELGNETYDSKIQGYSFTELGNENTTTATFIAKILFNLWFYVSIFYLYRNLRKRRDERYVKAFIFFVIPVLLFITFPGISNRYLFGAKFFFVIFLITDSFYWNNISWIKLFIILLSFQPLYDITRLLTKSLIAGYFRIDNISLITILMQTYTYKDMLPPY